MDPRSSAQHAVRFAEDPYQGNTKKTDPEEKLRDRGRHTHTADCHRSHIDCDLSSKEIDLLGFRGPLAPKANQPRLKVDGKTQIAGFVYVGISLATVCLASIFRENIIDENIYERFQENIDSFRHKNSLSGPLLVSDAIRFWSVCAYDVLIILYLLKPLKQACPEEKRLRKFFNDGIVKINQSKEKNIPEKLRIELNDSETRRRALKKDRLIVYNEIMLQMLLSCLAFDLVLGSAGFLSHSVFKVGCGLFSSLSSTRCLSSLFISKTASWGWSSSRPWLSSISTTEERSLTREKKVKLEIPS